MLDLSRKLFNFKYNENIYANTEDSGIKSNSYLCCYSINNVLVANVFAIPKNIKRKLRDHTIIS